MSLSTALRTPSRPETVKQMVRRLRNMNNIGTPNGQILVAHIIARARPKVLRKILNKENLPERQELNIEAAWLKHIMRGASLARIRTILNHYHITHHHRHIFFSHWVEKLLESGSVNNLRRAFEYHIPAEILKVHNAYQKQELGNMNYRRMIRQLHNQSKAVMNAWAVRKTSTRPINILRRSK